MGAVTIFLDDATEMALTATCRASGMDSGPWLSALVQQRLGEAGNGKRPSATILLVEDDPICREALRETLECMGWRVDSAEDGAEALALLARGSYALLLTDGRMPIMDGFQLARAVRVMEMRQGAKRLPIVAVTGEISRENERNGRSCGIDDYLRKPVALPVLLGALEKWLGGAPASNAFDPC